MVILNPLEPWPGELCLDAAARNNINVITRVVDYGGLFYDDLVPGAELGRHDHRSFRPGGWIEAGRARMEAMRPIADKTGLTMIQLACQWNLAHPAVKTVVPTLIQEAGPQARPVEDKRAELADLPTEQRLTDADVDAIRRIGDNTGSMALKGANPSFEGDERPDGWGMDDAPRAGGAALAYRSRARPDQGLGPAGWPAGPPAGHTGSDGLLREHVPVAAGGEASHQHRHEDDKQHDQRQRPTA